MSASPPPPPPPPSHPVGSAEPTLAERVRRSPVVWALGALNVAAFLWVEARGGSTQTLVMVDSGALVVPMPPGEPWRLLTSTFLHFGAFHLLSNMIGLALFGPPFEQLLGPRRFLALWLTSGLAGSAATILLWDGGLTIAAGASGSVFGLLGGFLFLGFRTRHTPDGAVRLRQASVLLGINLAYGFITPNIGVKAHVGGALAGVLVLAAYAAPRGATPPPPPTGRRRERGLVPAIALGVVCTAAALVLGPTFGS